MLKHLALSLLAVFFLYSCSNDLEVNDKWSDLTVVYGILDVTQDTNWIRVHRAWLGEDNVNVGAQSPDSIYYSQTINVSLEELNDDGSINKSFPLTYDNQSRNLNDGPFTTDGYHLYRTTEDLTPSAVYRLRIQKNNGNPEITAETIVLEDDLNMVKPSAAQLIPLEDGRDYTVQFDSQEGSKIFQTFITLHYKEHPIGSPDQVSFHSATVRLPSADVNNTAGDVRVIVGWSTETFLAGIRDEVPFDPNVWRYFRGLDFTVLAGDENLHTYINVNQPASGIVSERPDFSNIVGGYGLLASRALNGRYDKNLNEPGLNNLVLNDLTCDRNFVKVTTTDTCWCNMGSLVCN